MITNATEYTLEFLLEFDGQIHWYQGGYWVQFEIRRIEPTEERPYGLRYSFTLHGPDGTRLVGFDNAHPAPKPRRWYTRLLKTTGTGTGTGPNLIRADLACSRMRQR